MSKLTISVAPVDDLIDVARQMRVRGAGAGELLLVTSETERAGTVWRSSAYFVADHAGQIDLSAMAPVAGGYRTVSPMGLLWSQCPQEPGQRALFHADVTQPLSTRLQVQTLSQGDNAVASAVLIQRLCSADVIRQEVREAGLVGTLFLPPGAGPHPAVMILNGSGGGINEPRAALYASRGYAAFALAYFKAPGLSDYISNTPLEYFSRGLDWLRERIAPLADFVALSGQSRGGELVLLLAATFPEKVSAVLAYVPSALVHSAQNAADPAVGRAGPTWLLDGKPLLHQWENNRYASWRPFDEGPSPHRHALAMLSALRDAEAVARARIPVERIAAPVLLLSAGDDGSWPSAIYCRMISDKLNELAHPYALHWHNYQDAGHAVLFPYVPSTQTSYVHPVSGRVSSSGGQADANAVADHHAWQQAQAFLQDAVSAHLSRKETP